MTDIPELVVELPKDGIKWQSDENRIESKESSSTNNETNVDTSFAPSHTEDSKKIPLTLITGYLGSGKSSLLEMIGKKSKKRLAIILNEFGDSAEIEKSVTIQDSEKNEAVQEWLDLGNGCLCCTVKDSGVEAIERLVANSKYKIDHILLETTGVADPAPIARMFWLDEALASNIYIDGVVTVLDAENILKCLDDVGGHWHRVNNHLKASQSLNDDLLEEEILDELKKLEEGITTAHLQIALADVILLNKIDKVGNSKAKIDKITSRIKAINGSSPIHETSFGDIDLDKILHLNAFEGNSESLAKALQNTSNMSFHDDRIATVTLTFPFFNSTEQFHQIETFLQNILWEDTVNDKPVEIHRVKGLFIQQGDPPVVKVAQGVRDTYDIIEGGRLLDGVVENKLVLIGKGLNVKDLNIELNKYLKY
ncbi:uncharacterized protein PRCAT00004209001 [Priceomyces carsonii]|uniref:uncharacterized protein n=1 Tax=Priceomyces carsonii TaxID=28549 RepID=UPI002ED90CB8|nr:unnamed protein product [Priceomyces carsonii]